MKKQSIRKFVSSIRFRMLIAYLAFILVTFVVTQLLSMRVMEDTLVKESTIPQQSELNRIAYELTAPVENNDIEEIYSVINQYAKSANGRVLVLDKNYIVQADSAALYNGYYLPYDEAVNVLEGKSTSAYGFHRLYNPKEKKNEWTAYYAQPLSANGMNKGVLFLATSVQQKSDTIVSFELRVNILFCISVCIMTVFWIIITRSITKPVVALTDVMRNANAKTFEKRVDIPAKGEVAELVDAFNRMGSELNAHDKIRDQFVADASHELKTPLAAIKALSESVIYCDDPPADLMLDFLKDINTQVDRLNNIVQDLLQVARDSSNNVEYNMETLNLGDIVESVVRLIKPVAEKNGLKLNIYVEKNNIEILGDKMRIERVITNLVDNAVKYTEEGQIDVRVSRDGRDAVLSVKDTGIGIPEESLSHLFKRFYRVDKARSRATGGTGLGLSMVEDIVTRHGGTIKVESTLGVGSEFIVHIPLKK